MLLRETLVKWVGVHYGWRHASARITDKGFAYLVDPQPDAYLDGNPSAMVAGGGPDIALKRTGEIWQFSSSPALRHVYEAGTERRFRKALRKLGPINRPERIPFVWPPVVMPPAAPREITRAMVVEMLGGAASRHANARITDRAWGFVINNQPDAYLDGDSTAMVIGSGPYILVKRTGAIWYLPSRPEFWPIYEAADEHLLYVTMQVVWGTHSFDPAKPHDWFPMPAEVSIVGVIDWIRVTYGFSHLEDRVTDIGFAYVINTQPDAYLDGDGRAMTYGNGPAYVIKSSGAAWRLGSNPMMLPVLNATTEAEFYEALGADPANPDGWVRT